MGRTDIESQDDSYDMVFKTYSPFFLIDSLLNLSNARPNMFLFIAAKVETKVLTQAVKRNTERFPEDFMFQLTYQEVINLKSQIVTSSWGGIRRANPYAFSEQGVAMLSSILRSKRVVQVNIQIMRTFVKLRQMLAINADLARKLEALEKKYDSQFKVVFDAIQALMAEPEKPRKKIGFVVKETRLGYGKKKKGLTHPHYEGGKPQS